MVSVQRIFNLFGLQYVRHDQNFDNTQLLTTTIKSEIIWPNCPNKLGGGFFWVHMYQILKPNYGYEKYTYLNNSLVKLRTKFMKLRSSNHHCPVETSMSLCLLCNQGPIGDDFHFNSEWSALEKKGKISLHDKCFKLFWTHVNYNSKSLRKLCEIIYNIFDALFSPQLFLWSNPLLIPNTEINIIC